MPAAPPVALDVQLSTTPGTWTAPAAWQSIADEGRIRGIAIRRGGGGRGQPDPGETIVRCGVGDGWLTPGSGLGPYQGILSTPRQARVRASIIAEPGMETALATWVPVAGSTAARSEAQARGGTWSLAVGRAAALGDAEAEAAPRAAIRSGTGADTLEAVAWVRAGVGTARQARVGIRWYSSAGTVLSTSWGTSSLATAAWKVRTVTAAAPTGAYKAGLVVGYTAAGVADLLHVDDVALWQALTWGVVESWPTAQPGWVGQDVTSDVVMVDQVGALGATPSDSSVFVHEAKRGVLFPRPRHLWPLDASDTTGVEFVDEMAFVGAIPIKQPEAGGDSLVPFTDVRGIKGAETASAGGAVQFPEWCSQGGTPWAWMIVGRTTGYTTFLQAVDFQPVIMTVLADGKFKAQTYVAPTTYSTPVTAGIYHDDKPHLYIAQDNGSQLFAYIDGSYIGASPVHPALPSPTLRMQAAEGAAGATCAVALVTRWAVALTGAHITNVQACYAAPWGTDTAAVRAARLVDQLAALGVLFATAGLVDSVAPQRLDRRSLLRLLSALAEGHSAMLHPLRDGRVEFRERMPNPAVVVARWAWSQSQLGVVDVVVAGSGADAISTAEVTTDTGITAEYRDRSPGLPEARWSIDGAGLITPAAVWMRAEREVWAREPRGDWPARVVLRAIAVPDALTVDPGDRALVTWRPPFAAAPVVTDCTVVGVAHDAQGAGLADWTTSVDLLLTLPERRRQAVTAGFPLGATTPDTATISPAGSFEIIARAMFSAEPVAGVDYAVAAKYGTGSAHSWYLYARDRRIIFGGQRSDGVVVVVGGSWPYTVGRPTWVRGVVDTAANQLRVYTSEDGADWVLAGSAAVGPLTSMRDTTAVLQVGAITSVGVATVSQIVGAVYEAELRSGIGGGALLARFDPADAASLTAASWVSSATGETWTRNTGPLQQW